MTHFARVELHKHPDRYDELHPAMARQGFSREVTIAGVRYHLPQGMYRYEPSSTVAASSLNRLYALALADGLGKGAPVSPSDVADKAAIAARLAAPDGKFEIFVMDATSFAAYNLEPVGGLMSPPALFGLTGKRRG